MLIRSLVATCEIVSVKAYSIDICKFKRKGFGRNAPCQLAGAAPLAAVWRAAVNGPARA